MSASWRWNPHTHTHLSTSTEKGNQPSHPTIYLLAHPTRAAVLWSKVLKSPNLKQSTNLSSTNWNSTQILEDGQVSINPNHLPLHLKANDQFTNTTKHSCNIFNLHQEKRHWLGLPTVASAHAAGWVSLEAGAPVQCREVLERAKVVRAYVWSHT